MKDYNDNIHRPNPHNLYNNISLLCPPKMKGNSENLSTNNKPNLTGKNIKVSNRHDKMKDIHIHKLPDVENISSDMNPKSSKMFSFKNINHNKEENEIHLKDKYSFEKREDDMYNMSVSNMHKVPIHKQNIYSKNNYNTSVCLQQNKKETNNISYINNIHNTMCITNNKNDHSVEHKINIYNNKYNYNNTFLCNKKLCTQKIIQYIGKNQNTKHPLHSLYHTNVVGMNKFNSSNNLSDQINILNNNIQHINSTFNNLRQNNIYKNNDSIELFINNNLKSGDTNKYATFYKNVKISEKNNMYKQKEDKKQINNKNPYIFTCQKYFMRPSNVLHNIQNCDQNRAHILEISPLSLPSYIEYKNKNNNIFSSYFAHPNNKTHNFKKIKMIKKNISNPFNKEEPCGEKKNSPQVNDSKSFRYFDHSTCNNNYHNKEYMKKEQKSHLHSNHNINHEKGSDPSYNLNTKNTKNVTNTNDQTCIYEDHTFEKAVENNKVMYLKNKPIQSKLLKLNNQILNNTDQKKYEKCIDHGDTCNNKDEKNIKCTYKIDDILCSYNNGNNIKYEREVIKITNKYRNALEKWRYKFVHKNKTTKRNITSSNQKGKCNFNIFKINKHINKKKNKKIKKIESNKYGNMYNFVVKKVNNNQGNKKKNEKKNEKKNDKINDTINDKINHKINHKKNDKINHKKNDKINHKKNDKINNKKNMIPNQKPINNMIKYNIKNKKKIYNDTNDHADNRNIHSHIHKKVPNKKDNNINHMYYDNNNNINQPISYIHTAYDNVCHQINNDDHCIPLSCVIKNRKTRRSRKNKNLFNNKKNYTNEP
ncbi:hypothetical protein C923_05191 [Plasmodium falciparum UGT5.1]|uniref:Uncharacterized protein n=1 Tax=Plasmodium falciparum UGT5.1 TaxID=1237627 RepID=W7J6C6_PLAFA|nr:hypothetical protein C923_05191 [Plasmodium falciparum UGT5.1]